LHSGQWLFDERIERENSEHRFNCSHDADFTQVDDLGASAVTGIISVYESDFLSMTQLVERLQK
jgi:hypothetical protein